MSTATVPRVRTMVICDEAVSSEIEADVYTLENVRMGIEVERFPHLRWFCVYLDLSHSRTGTFQGEVRLMRDGAGAKVRWTPFSVEFVPGRDRVSLYVEIGECRFPASGGYTFEVWFLDEESQQVQKGEGKFAVDSLEAET